MERFLDSVNMLQSLLSIVETDIQMPQIIVVGEPGSGKSSVLESIAGNGLFPRGTGIATRTPVILRLRNSHSEYTVAEETFAEISYDELNSDGLVSTVVRHIDNVDNVSAEILEAIEILTGQTKDNADKPVSVAIYNCKFPELTLIDLPGIPEILAPNAPKDPQQPVEDLIFRYISNKHAIILAVHQATSDLAGCKSLRLAQKTDPEGKRTICVVTKLDLVEDNVDLTSLLNGNVVTTHNFKVQKVIGVMNRATVEIPEISAKAQQKKERKFLNSNYKTIAKEHGTGALSDCLSLMFIRKFIPPHESDNETDTQNVVLKKQLATLRRDLAEKEALVKQLSDEAVHEKSERLTRVDNSGAPGEAKVTVEMPPKQSAFTNNRQTPADTQEKKQGCCVIL